MLKDLRWSIGIVFTVISNSCKVYDTSKPEMQKNVRTVKCKIQNLNDCPRALHKVSKTHTL